MMAARGIRLSLTLTLTLTTINTTGISTGPRRYQS